MQQQQLGCVVVRLMVLFPPVVLHAQLYIQFLLEGLDTSLFLSANNAADTHTNTQTHTQTSRPLPGCADLHVSMYVFCADRTVVGQTVQ